MKLMKLLISPVKGILSSASKMAKEEDKLAVPSSEASPVFTKEDVSSVKSEMSRIYRAGVLNDPSSLNRAVLELKKIQPGDFPTIQDDKIQHAHFISRKEEYVSAAFEAVRPYFSYVIHLPAIGRDTELSKALEIVIKGFIATYWDMPSSKDHHDSLPFGHVRHSMIVACKEAERLSRTNIFNSNGTLDSERTRKMRPYVVIAGFLAGLFHDADKIFNYDLSCVLSADTKTYSPFHGSASILEFQMKYPKSRLRRRWKKNEYPNIYFGFHLFYTIVPQSLRKVLPGEMYEFIYVTMQHYKGMADQIATKESLQDDNYLGKIQAATHELIMQTDAVNHPNGWGFKISHAWYLVLPNKFLPEIAFRLGAVPDSCEKVLYDSGIMQSSPTGGNGYTQIGLYMAAGKTTKLETAAFMSAAFFDDILSKTGVRLPIPRYPVKIDSESRPAVEALALAPPLPDSAFYTPPSPRNNPSDLPRLKQDDTGIEHQAPQIDPKAQAKANPLKSNDEHKEIAVPKAIIKRMGQEFVGAAPEIYRALAAALANNVGSGSEIIPQFNIQRTADERTVFYLLKDTSLIARSPLVLRLTWSFLIEEIRNNIHPWALTIKDMPPGLSGEDPFSRALIHSTYAAWVRMGLLMPSGGDNTFLLSRQPVVLIQGYKKKKPILSDSTISGEFIRLSVTTLLCLAPKAGSLFDQLYFNAFGGNVVHDGKS